MHIESTDIAGLRILRLDLHGDNRGWFKENWQRAKMVAAGLPDFRPVQNNVSFNAQRGVTRGLHAEPWDKLVSVAHGRVFGAWCDLRESSPTFGELVTCEIGPETAVFVPRGVANGFQALRDNTAYSYLVNDHWSPEANYTAVNLEMVDWPLEPTEISAKDEGHPPLSEVTPMPPKKILVTGADGQLGRQLRRLLADADFTTRAEFDITAEVDHPHYAERDFSQYRAIINCAAYNDVAGAEDDRATCWAVNALAPARLAAVAAEHNLTLVHVSSDYVFGNPPSSTEEAERIARTGHTEEESPAPLSLYGASKAAGEAAASTAPRHYVVRTSWVIGEGKNFVRTMATLANRGVCPSVVSDQRGRPTFTEDLAAGIVHLLDNEAPFGTYNITSGGDCVGWDEVAMATFIAVGHDPSEITPVSSERYAEIAGPQPARPHESLLDLSKIEATGFHPRNWRAQLAVYAATLGTEEG